MQNCLNSNRTATHGTLFWASILSNDVCLSISQDIDSSTSQFIHYLQITTNSPLSRPTWQNRLKSLVKQTMRLTTSFVGNGKWGGIKVIRTLIFWKKTIKVFDTYNIPGNHILNAVDLDEFIVDDENFVSEDDHEEGLSWNEIPDSVDTNVPVMNNTMVGRRKVYSARGIRIQCQNCSRTR